MVLKINDTLANVSITASLFFKEWTTNSRKIIVTIYIIVTIF